MYLFYMKSIKEYKQSLMLYSLYNTVHHTSGFFLGAFGGAHGLISRASATMAFMVLLTVLNTQRQHL